VVLWKWLAKNDYALFEMSKMVSAALTQSTESNRQLREIIEQNRELFQANTEKVGPMTVSVDSMSRNFSNCPCVESYGPKRESESLNIGSLWPCAGALPSRPKRPRGGAASSDCGASWVVIGCGQRKTASEAEVKPAR
jgi:hypothetical protein